MKFFYKKLLFLFSVWMFASCGIVGEDAVVVPAYISVPSFTFVTDSLTQGANSQGFNDMWIFDGGLLIGSVGLPSLLPVQRSGKTQIVIDAGISRSGQDNQRVPYPLIESYRTTRTLAPNVIDTTIPVFKYLPNVDFKFIEDYDRAFRSLKINPAYYLPGDTVMEIKDDRAWRLGNNCGKIELGAGNQRILQLLSGQYLIDGQGSPVYLEIDYKSNLPLDFGYYYNDPITGPSRANSVIQTFSNSNWRKLYINLTDEIAARKVGTEYIIYIGIYNFDNIIPEVYIDNVKLITLKG